MALPSDLGGIDYEEMPRQRDVEGLRDKVKAMYQAVAGEPQGTFHFEMGYDLAARLGYPTAELDAVPAEAIEFSPASATTSASPG